jgi:chemotaxis protein methyltransferase CheR
VLEIARTAVYPEALIEPVSMDLRHRYLMRGRDRQRAKVRIVPELREKVRFARLNFMDEDYAVSEQFDTIFFRNVMIYFDRPTQQQVVRKLCRNLKPGGYLFAGHSESLVGLDLPVRPVSTSVFQKIR